MASRVLTVIGTQMFSVNPQAINEPGFDVLTANTRSILYLKHIPTGQLIAYVAVGALLVGSIQWTGGKEKGTILKRGDELGYSFHSIALLCFQSVLIFDFTGTSLMVGAQSSSFSRKKLSSAFISFGSTYIPMNTPLDSMKILCQTRKSLLRLLSR